MNGFLIMLFSLVACKSDKQRTVDLCESVLKEYDECNQKAAQAVGETYPEYDQDGIEEMCNEINICMEERLLCIKEALKLDSCETEDGFWSVYRAIEQCEQPDDCDAFGTESSDDTAEPSDDTAEPSGDTAEPTSEPTCTPTSEPTVEPTSDPSTEPSTEPGDCSEFSTTEECFECFAAENNTGYSVYATSLVENCYCASECGIECSDFCTSSDGSVSPSNECSSCVSTVAADEGSECVQSFSADCNASPECVTFADALATCPQ